MNIDKQKFLSKKTRSLLESVIPNIMTVTNNDETKENELIDTVYTVYVEEIDNFNTSDNSTIGNNVHRFIIALAEESDILGATLYAWCHGKTREEIQGLIDILNCESEYFNSIGNSDISLLCKTSGDKLFYAFIHPQDIIAKESSRFRLQQTLYAGRIAKYATLESTIGIKMNIISSNINTNPSAVKDFAKVLRDIETSSPSSMLTDCVELLNDGTTLLLSIDIDTGIGMEKMIASLPVTITKRLVEIQRNSNKPEKILVTFSKSLLDQKGRLIRELKDGSPKHYVLYTSYLDGIDRSIQMIEDARNKTVLESSDDIDDENVEYDEVLLGDTQLYSEGVMDDLTGDIDEIILDMLDDEDERTPEECLESLMVKMNALYEKYNIALEANKRQVTKVGKAVNKMARKAGQSPTNFASRAVKAILEDTERIIEKLREKDRQARIEMILDNSFKGKILRMLRKIINIIAVGTVAFLILPAAPAGVIGGVYTALSGAAIKLIGLIGGLAISSKMDKRDRALIIKDLELELKIVREKIGDSRGDSNKAKYELMRIENKLERNIEQIKYKSKVG